MNIIPNGTEVLIFKYIREWDKQNEENYIIGTIQSSKTSDDLSYHGSPWYEQIYEVLGQDEKTYIGCYGRGLIGNSYFRTIDDNINVLKSRITDNEQEILKIQEKNKDYEKQIIELEEILNFQEQKESIITKKLTPHKKHRK